jgi:hypothetical protein
MKAWNLPVPAALALVVAASGHGQEAPDGLRFPASARLVAIGDLHGDAAATRRAFRLAGAIDETDRWVGGDLVVVQTGDQLDRGDGEIELLGLLDRATAEAAVAGGMVQVLNGNHELMNVQGKMRYVTPGGFAAFRGLPGLDLRNPELARHPEAERARRAAFAPGGPFALRLARRNVVVVVGDTVFVHGGVLPPAVAYGLARLNTETRAWLRGELPEPPEILLSRFGPVWSRHYSANPGATDCALLARTLRMLGAARMVVGHSTQEGGINAKCGGLVWCIDVGLSSHFGGPTQVLELRGGTPRVLGSPAAQRP